MRARRVTFSMLACHGKRLVKLYKGSIFVITEAQFATQGQVM